MSEKEDATEVVVKNGNTPLKIILIAVGACVLIMLLVQIFGGTRGSSYAEYTPLPSRPQINETVSIGSFEIKIEDAQRNGDQITLKINAKNVSDKADSVYSDSIKLRSDNGAEYTAGIAIGLMKINPGINKTAEITFEVPKETTGITAAIRPDMVDFGGAEYTLIDIGL